MFQFILLFSIALQDPTVTIDGAEIVSADHGDLVALAPPSDGESRTRWIIQDGFSGYAVDPSSGSIYISMPKHDLLIDLVIAPNNIDKRIQIKRFRLQYSGTPTPEPEPQPTPTPEPYLPIEYDGPNYFEIGQATWDISKGMTPDEAARTKDLLVKGVGHLRGYGGLKFVDSEDKSDDNIFHWLKSEINPDALGIIQALEDLKNRNLSLADWDNAFDEAIQALSVRQYIK